MVEFLKLIIAVLSTASFVALSIYIFLAARGKSELLYATISSRLKLSWINKAFFAFAAIGFLICMYKGAEAMLYWMPSSWGTVDSDGEYLTFRSYVALLFTALGGIPFVAFIDKATHDKFELRELEEYSRGQEKIINALHSPESFPIVRKEFETSIEEIQSKMAKRRVPPEWEVVRLLPDGRRIQLYRRLIGNLDSLVKR